MKIESLFSIKIDGASALGLLADGRSFQDNVAEPVLSSHRDFEVCYVSFDLFKFVLNSAAGG